MVQILHYFAGRKQPYIFKNKILKEDDKYFMSLSKDGKVSNNANRLVNKYSNINPVAHKLVNVYNVTTIPDAWRFGGFFYDIKNVRLDEVRRFFVFHGANETVLSDTSFLRLMVVFFSFFYTEAFLLFFFRFVNVFELYFLFSSGDFSYFCLLSVVSVYNRTLSLLRKIGFLKSYYRQYLVQLIKTGILPGLRAFDFTRFLFNLSDLQVSLEHVNDKYTVSFLITKIDLFVEKAVKSLVLSLYSFYDASADKRHTNMMNIDFYRQKFFVNKPGIVSDTFAGRNSMHSFVLLQKSFSLLSTAFLAKDSNVFTCTVDIMSLLPEFSKLGFNLYSAELLFFFEYLLIIRVFFFHLLRFFKVVFNPSNAYVRLGDNGRWLVFVFFLRKLYLAVKLRLLMFFNFFGSFIFSNPFFNFLVPFMIFFNKIFFSLFFSVNLAKFVRRSQHFFALLGKIFFFFFLYRFMVFFFNGSAFFGRNFLFSSFSVARLVFDKSLVFFDASITGDDVTPMLRASTMCFLDEDFLHLVYWRQFASKFRARIFGNFSMGFVGKIYFYYLSKFYYLNTVFDFFVRFSFPFLTERTRYEYFFLPRNMAVSIAADSYIGIKEYVLGLFLQLRDFALYSTSLPYYNIIYNVLGFQKYLYLPVKFRLATNIEHMFSLVNFQNFSEYFEEDVDELVVDGEELFDPEDVFDEDEDYEDIFEYHFEFYKENDYFSLFFIEDLNSLSFYLSSMYDVKFGIEEFIFDDLYEYDSLFLSLSYYKHERANFVELQADNENWDDYLEDMVKAVNFYSFFFLAMHKYFVARTLWRSSLPAFDSLDVEVPKLNPYGDLFVVPVSEEASLRRAFFFSKLSSPVSMRSVKFNKVPFLLDLSWWWEFWYLQNLSPTLRAAEYRDEFRDANPYFGLLDELVDGYIDTIDINLVFKQFYSLDFKGDSNFVRMVNFLLDRIFVDNLKRNFFYFYRSVCGFELFLEQIISILVYFFLYYKLVERYVFFDFVGDNEYKGLAAEVLEQDFYDDLDDFKLSARETESLVQDYQEDDAYAYIHLREAINNHAIRYFVKQPKYYKNTATVLRRKHVRSLDDWFFRRNTIKLLHSSLDVSEAFDNTYELNFNYNEAEMYIANLYMNFSESFTYKTDLSETFNFFEDYRLKFFNAEHEFKYAKARTLAPGEDAAESDLFEDDYTLSPNYFKFRKPFDANLYPRYEKLSLFDYRVGESLDIYIMRLNSISLKTPFDIVRFDFNFPEFFCKINDLNDRSGVFGGQFIQESDVKKVYDVVYVFNFLLKRVFAFTKFSKNEFNFLLFYFKSFFFFFINKTCLFFFWLYALHFFIFRYVLRLGLARDFFGFFFFMLPNIFFFFLVKNFLRLSKIDACFLKARKSVFIKFMTSIIFNFSTEVQLNLFRAVFFDIKKFFFFFLRSVRSYHFRVLFFKSYVPLLKISLHYDFFVMFIELFLVFSRILSSSDFFFVEKELKPGFFFVTVFDLSITSSLRNYVNSLLLYYSGESEFFAQLTDIAYLKWLSNFEKGTMAFFQKSKVDLENDFSVLELKHRLNCFSEYFNQEVLYGLFFSHKFSNGFFDPVVPFFFRGEPTRVNYDSVFVIDTELVDFSDFALQQSWVDFELEDIDDEEDFVVAGDDDEEYDYDEWEDIDMVDDVVEDKTTEPDDIFATEGEEFDYELDLDVYASYFFQTKDVTVDSLDFEEGDSERTDYNGQVGFPRAQRWFLLVDMFLTRNLEIMRNLFIGYFMSYRMVPRKHYAYEYNPTLPKRFRKPTVKPRLFVREASEDAFLNLSDSFFENNKSLLTRVYQREFFEDLDYFVLNDNDISEFGVSYTTLDTSLGFPLSDMQSVFSGVSKNRIFLNDGVNFHRLRQNAEVSMLNFGILLRNKIYDRRLSFFLYNFGYLLKSNDLLPVYRLGNNWLKFYEYVVLLFKKTVFLFFKGFFSVGKNYFDLPFLLDEGLFKFFFRKVYLHAIQEFLVYSNFKRLYKFTKPNQRRQFRLIKSLVSRLSFTFDVSLIFNQFDNDGDLVQIFDFVFNSFVFVYSLNDFFLRVHRLFIYRKFFYNKLSLLGLFYLDDFVYWFMINNANLASNRFLVWRLLQLSFKSILADELLFFRWRYELFQIFSNHGFGESFRFFNNLIMQRSFENELKQVSSITRFFFFLRDFYVYFIVFCFVVFLVLDWSGDFVQNGFSIPLNWTTMDPLFSRDQESDPFFNIFKSGEGLMLREFFLYYFDFWGLF